MADKITKQQRSRNMSRVKNKNTRPELVVRKALHRLGYRFRLHRKDIPGSPDIVLPRYRKAIFVHGCFWHGHDCPRGKRPASNQAFWDQKLDRNMKRDTEVVEKLNRLGWDVLVIWDCETKELDAMEEILLEFMQESNSLPEMTPQISALPQMNKDLNR